MLNSFDSIPSLTWKCLCKMCHHHLTKVQKEYSYENANLYISAKIVSKSRMSELLTVNGTWIYTELIKKRNTKFELELLQ